MSNARAERGRITVDLQSLKEEFAEYCEKELISTSDQIRELVRQLLVKERGDVSPRIKAPNPNVEKGATTRVEVRFSASEAASAMEIVDYYRYENLPRMIVALLRAHITQSPQLGQNEYLLLANSNKKLLSLGRNLNQIAKALNKHEQTDKITVERIQLLSQSIDNHTTLVSQLLAANIERWGVK